MDEKLEWKIPYNSCGMTTKDDDQGLDSFHVCWIYKICFSSESKLISWAWTIAAEIYINHVIYINPSGDDQFMMKPVHASCKQYGMLEKLSDSFDIGGFGGSVVEENLDLSEYIK